MEKKKRKYNKQHLLRKRYAMQLRRFTTGYSACKKIAAILGCDKKYFREYIESKWAIGMCWENYLKEWGIDHVVPMVFFNHENNDEIGLCWNYQNLQPLFHADNHTKDHCPFAAKFFLDMLPESEIKSKLHEINNRNLRNFDKYNVRLKRLLKRA